MFENCFRERNSHLPENQKFNRDLAQQIGWPASTVEGASEKFLIACSLVLEVFAGKKKTPGELLDLAMAIAP